MPQYTVHTADSAPAESATAIATLVGRIGFLPNVAAVMAGSPVLLNGFVGLQSSLATSSLTDVEREVIALTVGRTNAAAYPVALHSTVAALRGAAPEVIHALRDGKPVPDAKLDALSEFTSALLRTRGHLDAESVAAFLAAGYSTEQLFDVIAQVGFSSIANWVANLCDPPLDAAFQANAWSAS
jgi:AhpD family alkylhydroperoxidase